MSKNKEVSGELDDWILTLEYTPEHFWVSYATLLGFTRSVNAALHTKQATIEALEAKYEQLELRRENWIAEAKTRGLNQPVRLGEMVEILEL